MPHDEGEYRDLLPHDRFNLDLIRNVRPPGWVNPRPAPVYDLVVVGAGTAGLVAAEAAAALGYRAALVEKRLIGGDCLNLGCVPSKTIISSSRVSEEVREAPGHGVRVLCGSEPDFPAVMERMRRLRARISRHHSAATLKDMGVDVFLGEGVFLGRDTVEVAEAVLKFKKALIATGARPFHPPLSGLAEAGYMTSETVFGLTERPARLAVLGGGAIGCEMAQAFQRLGSRVTLLHNKPRLMHGEDPDASAIVRRSLARDGVRIVLGDWTLERVEPGREKTLVLTRDGEVERVAVDEVLVSVGRSPNVADLGLEAAGVAYDDRSGVKVDAHLRTTNPDVYAAGDVCLRLKFNHTAEAAARIVVDNALLGGKSRFDGLVVPWCTFTDPEVAQVGVCEIGPPSPDGDLETYTQPFSEVDRAVLEGEEEGFLRVHVAKGTDKLVGATIVARRAGEMIGELTLAMSAGVGLRELSRLIHPYPTFSGAIKDVAEMYSRAHVVPELKRRRRA